jgi:salicylate biosynthesis isochorismate synthase
VEAIERHLAPYCERLIVQAEPKIVVLPHLQHLCSEVQGSLEPGRHVLDIVHELHPTPAVSGWPTQEAQTWLQQHEEMQRGWYAGAIGWFNHQGDGTFAVSIRSALLSGQTAIAFAGAGIVPDSNPAAEWTETEWKLTTVQQALILEDGAL